MEEIMSSGYEIAKEKDIRELFDLQLRAFEKPGGFQELDGACKAQ